MSTPRSLDLPHGVTPIILETGRVRHAALRADAGTGSAGPSPVVLLLPGWTGSKEDFAPLLPLLAAAGYDAVTLDQRGQYETPGTDDPADYTPDALGADASAVVELLAGSGTPVHLLGHSYGGVVARAAYRRHPDRVASLALLCTGPGAVPEGSRALLTTMADAIGEVGLPATYAAKLQHERSLGAPELTPAIGDFMRRRFLANHPVSLAEITRGLASVPDDVDGTAAVLATHPVPVLVAAGADDDGWPQAQQGDMAVRLGTTLRRIDGAGHSPAVEQPEALADLLVAFYRSGSSTPAQSGRAGTA